MLLASQDTHAAAELAEGLQLLQHRGSVSPCMLSHRVKAVDRTRRPPR